MTSFNIKRRFDENENFAEEKVGSFFQIIMQQIVDYCQCFG